MVFASAISILFLWSMHIDSSVLPCVDPFFRISVNGLFIHLLTAVDDPKGEL
jgi:hypothetical protein